MNILQYGGFWGCVWNDSSWCPSRRWRISTLVLKYGPLRTICWPPPWNWREKLVRRNTRYESVRYVVIVRYRAALSNCTRKECILFKELEHSCWSMKLLCFPWFCKNFLFSKKNLMQLCVTIKLRVSFVEKGGWKRKNTKYGSSILIFYKFLNGGKKHENEKMCEKWTHLNHFAFFMVICFGLIYFNILLFGINCAISVCQLNNRFWVMMKEEYE